MPIKAVLMAIAGAAFGHTALLMGRAPSADIVAMTPSAQQWPAPVEVQPPSIAPIPEPSGAISDLEYDADGRLIAAKPLDLEEPADAPLSADDVAREDNSGQIAQGRPGAKDREA